MLINSATRNNANKKKRQLGANGSDNIRPYLKIKYGYPILEYPYGYRYGKCFKF